jgi:hypothetical protein
MKQVAASIPRAVAGRVFAFLGLDNSNGLSHVARRVALVDADRELFSVSRRITRGVVHGIVKRHGRHRLSGFACFGDMSVKFGNGRG